nr:hypothetical protein [Tanacetum cinerariifolium]
MMSDSNGGGLSDLDDIDDLDMIMQQVQAEQEQEEEAEQVRHRNYIYRERIEAEECLKANYFGPNPKYPVAGENNDLTVLNNSSLFDDLLDDIALVAPFECNGLHSKKEKNALFNRKQESARKDVERAFGVLQGHWRIICPLAPAWTVNKLRRVILRMALTASFAAESSMSWATDLHALDLSILIGVLLALSW